MNPTEKPQRQKTPDARKKQSPFAPLMTLLGIPLGARNIYPDQPAVHSPFWPLFLVFLTLATLQAFNLKTTLEQHGQLQKNQREMGRNLPNARMMLETVEALGRDLIVLSGSSEEARAIVTEFQIRINETPVAP
jgi:hypothetical protein